MVALFTLCTCLVVSGGLFRLVSNSSRTCWSVRFLCFSDCKRVIFFFTRLWSLRSPGKAEDCCCSILWWMGFFTMKHSYCIQRIRLCRHMDFWAVASTRWQQDLLIPTRGGQRVPPHDCYDGWCLFRSPKNVPQIGVGGRVASASRLRGPKKEREF